MKCAGCGGPLEPTTYLDDFSGLPVERLRCQRCYVTYIPKETENGKKKV